jgi:hypothetical protein
MDVPLLVDGIVRQTMVLIAQISTASGQRAPLSQVADRVFLDLVHELERQQVGKKIIADMFGLALRSYQQKVQRLGESATDRGNTLWSAVFGYVRDAKVVTKLQVLQRFARDDESSVRGILTDLVESGLVYQSGRGDAALFRATDADDWTHATGSEDARTLATWLLVYRDGPATLEQIARNLRVEPGEAEGLLAPLVSDGRVTATDTQSARTYSTESCVIPLGAASGFEAAIIDHFRAVAAALAAKIRQGLRRSSPGDTTGGSTLTFEIARGHALEGEVTGSLARMRSELIDLWNRVRDENERRPNMGFGYRVTVYAGQYVERETSSEEDS